MSLVIDRGESEAFRHICFQFLDTCFDGFCHIYHITGRYSGDGNAYGRFPIYAHQVAGRSLVTFVDVGNISQTKVLSTT